MPSQLNSTSSSWKQEVNRRVAAHKNRKGPVRVEPGHLELTPKPATSRAAEVLARVNARYAKAPSYNTALAEEARAVVRSADAAPLQAVASSPVAEVEPVALQQELIAQPAAFAAPVAEPVQQQAEPLSYEIRWSQELPEQRLEPASRADSALQAAEVVPQSWQGTAQQEAVLETPAIEVVDGGHPIPGNLIQFPRELVAPRKARRNHESEDEFQPQLSIFEVDPATVTPLLDEPVAALPEPVYAEPREEQSYAAYAEPAYAEPVYAQETYSEPVYAHRAHFEQEQYVEPVYAESAYAEPVYAESAYAPAAEAYAEAYPDALTPRWIEEEQAPAAQPVQKRAPSIRQKRRSPELDLAPLSTRLLAGVVNISLMLSGLVLAGLTAARGEVLPGLQRMELSAVVGLALIALLYTSIFYLLSDSTPGMRYAHLRLVKFDGRRSTRADRFVRIGCLVLSALPLGMGFLSMLWDKENLSWHDKLSGTYLRRY